MAPYPKTCLVVFDLDNTLLAQTSHHGRTPPAHRAYIQALFKYLLHPHSPYEVAFWTFAGRKFGLAHCRAIGLPIFASDDDYEPQYVPGVVGFWGREDGGGVTPRDRELGRCPKDGKNLSWLWDFLNNVTWERGDPKYNEHNSVLVDDQVHNARAHPGNIIVAPAFVAPGNPQDPFLLQLIGALDYLSRKRSFQQEILSEEFQWCTEFNIVRSRQFADIGTKVCRSMGITAEAGPEVALPEHLEHLSGLGPEWGPAHEHHVPTDTAGRVATKYLQGCCQDPHPASVVGPRPPIARDARRGPSDSYLRDVAVSSHSGRRAQDPVLVVLDLDGTLYGRPDCLVDPHGDPAPRPYLRPFLQYLFHPGSRFVVAIWTASMPDIAAHCLASLEFGLTSAQLVAGRIQSLDPRLVAVWTRKDLGLRESDYKAYVSVTKDLDKLWHSLHHHGFGQFTPFNTVVVDDTADKLRAQPDNVVSPSRFTYPMAPDEHSMSAELDTFLLELIGALEELAPQTNVAEYIAAQHWNASGKAFGRRSAELRNQGLATLKQLGIPAAAQGRGLVFEGPGAVVQQQARRHSGGPLVNRVRETGYNHAKHGTPFGAQNPRSTHTRKDLIAVGHGGGHHHPPGGAASGVHHRTGGFSHLLSALGANTDRPASHASHRHHRQHRSRSRTRRASIF